MQDLELGKSRGQSREAAEALTKFVTKAHSFATPQEVVPILIDVAPSIHRIMRLYSAVSDAGLGFPCFEVKDPDFPIVLYSFSDHHGELNSNWKSIVLSDENWKRFAADLIHHDSAGFYRPVLVEPDNALKIMQTALTEFLLVRFQNVRSNAPIDQALDLTVFTLKDGDRVHKQLIYDFDPHDVFGGPTSPVTNSIAPGIYRFGVKTPGDKGIRMDSGRFHIPRKPMQVSLHV